MGQYTVKLGGVYSTEAVPGTVGDPTDPSAVTFLDPTIMTVGANALNELRCISNLNSETFASSTSNGMWIQISDSGNIGTSSSSSGSNTVIFDGVIVNRHIRISGDTETTELVAFDHGSWLLHRIPVHGQWRRGYALESAYDGGTSVVTVDPSQLLLIDAPTCFNPNGTPNMTAQLFQYSGESGLVPTFPLFEKPYRNDATASGVMLTAQFWTLSQAIVYLLNVTNANWCIDAESFNQTVMTEVFGDYDPVVSNINVEGDSLLVALERLMSPHNYAFWVDPALNSNNLHNINFFYRGAGPHKTIDLSPRGTNANVSNANMVFCDIVLDNASTVNYLQSFGDRILCTTLPTSPAGSSSSSGGMIPTLVQGWKSSDLVFPTILSGDTQPNWIDTTFRKNYCNPQLVTPPTGSETNGSYGVGRMWIVNLGEVPWKAIENLSSDLKAGGSSSSSSSGGINTTVTGTNSIDPRRFENPELYTGNSEGGYLTQQEIVVELSTNGGSNWAIVDRSEYRILPNSMGIVFTQPSLDYLGIDISTLDGNDTSSSSSGSGMPGKGYWQALYDGTLQIRILCSIKSDERIHCTIANDGSAYPLAIGGVFNNPGFRRTIYNPAINNATYFVKYPPLLNNRDDTTNITEVSQAQLANTNRTQISGSAAVLFENYGDYTVGDVITGISNRTAIEFSAGTFPGPTVIHIVYKFQEQQAELHLDNHRTATIVKQKAINAAASMREHKLGIANPTPMQGGHGGDYLPETTHTGMNPSWQKWLESGGGME